MHVYVLLNLRIHLPASFVEPSPAGSGVIASEAREPIAVLLESFISDDLLKFEESGDKSTASRMLMNVVPAGLVKHF